ncbi:MAG: hypothetical protein BWY02_01926 [bacterium ADurb.Bin157]|nr:MAG: hypothetical protein BWY02_01926 [bacterium ADurb.Bin157]
MLVKIKKPELEERSLEELLRLHAKAASKFVALKKQPRVGIFWYHNKKVLGDFFDFASAEVYGNVVGPRSNHYDFWEKIQAATPELACEEYEYIPRGRVLFDLIEGTFVIISSAAIIANKSALKAICRHSNIPDNFLVTLKTDQHYENPNNLEWEED